MSQDTEDKTTAELLGFQGVINASGQWEDAWLSLCKKYDSKDIVLRAFLLPATDEWGLAGVAESMTWVEGIPDFPEPLPVLLVEGLEQPTVAFSANTERAKARVREHLEEVGAPVPESLMPAQE